MKTAIKNHPLMESPLNIIRICASCTKINAGEEDLDLFHRAVEKKIREKRPDLEIQIERSACLKVCPVDRITFTLNLDKSPEEDRLTMSREASIESVANEVLSFFKVVHH